MIRSAVFSLLLVCLTTIVYSVYYVVRRLLVRPRPPFPTELTYETPTKKDLPLPSLDDAPELDLTIVVPAFNERERLRLMLDEALEHLQSDKTTVKGWEILLVDDGSTDGTADVALCWGRERGLLDGRLRVCRLGENRGKGGAVTHGMQRGRGRYIGFADADGATRFSDIDVLVTGLRAIEVDGHGLAGGSRAHMVKTEAVVQRSLLRNALMYGFHTFISILGVRHIKDTQCGFKLLTRKSSRLIFPQMHIERWAFDVEIWLLAHWLNVPSIELPVNWHEVGGSKINLVNDSINMAKDLLLMRTGYTLGLWQIKGALVAF
ncbi:dolichyl-phosphate beta-glucosyltransferase [Savitreella phatthalungensis]